MISEFAVGSTVDFLTTIDDYPPADGWTLKHRFTPLAAGGGTAFTLTATTSGTDYSTQVSPATSALWTAGDYAWFSWVEKTGARIDIESGQVTLLPDPSSATSLDNRSHNRIVLAAIRAVIEGRASVDQMEYSIADRSLKRTPLADLRAMEKDYAGRVFAEDQAERIANGQKPKNRLVVRL